jgi:predicted phosphohydrolase
MEGDAGSSERVATILSTCLPVDEAERLVTSKVDSLKVVSALAGDISWAAKPHEVLPDLAWLDARPGRKVLVKGNHDFWWGGSGSGLRRLLEPYRTFVGRRVSRQ